MAHKPSVSKDAIKEGIKKAQYFSTIHKLGGLEFFSCSVETPQGDREILLDVLDGMNKEKAGKWGKVVVSANDLTVSGVVHVPKELAKSSHLDAIKWAKYIVANTYKAEMTFESEELIEFSIKIDPFEEVFSFKLCDEILENSTRQLRILKLLPPKHEESDDEANYNFDW